MRNESKTMQELHTIRLGIYEKIKDMTLEEQMDYYNNSTRDTVKQYQITVATPQSIRRHKAAV
ncbi:MAG: hypothetical protein LBS98_08215 [Coriobacteriales bacterium]|jgi:hypothetical protein|nr:hypothetical protein [Coriobacteriales bacterium]